ncbi:UPF0149 family protein [Aquabacterium sp. J223]|uniref:UPF0149 family protein n=1 Tax=Aquabacterium sp. J223 TaxID=2898431 RepID=UPI0021AE300E|nr:UPF0149 family protein [Aquabacterium sp. J223]UUX96109.1 UPF0149 family protein [Aquabacterium sp. J223]
MAQDLNDSELDELAQGLDLPEPLEPLDVVMLDGFLCGVLVQPRLVPVDEWWPFVADHEGRPPPEGTDLSRVRVLAERRLAALNEAIAEDGAFDPLLPADDAALAEQAGELGLPAWSAVLMGWVAGFELAMARLGRESDPWPDEADALFERLLRHLPAEDGEDVRAREAAEAEFPLASTDEAIDDLVDAVVGLWDATVDARYQVAPRRHAAPPVGRNDPCPCGSGRKFKKCHGA